VFHQILNIVPLAEIAIRPSGNEIWCAWDGALASQSAEMIEVPAISFGNVFPLGTDYLRTCGMSLASNRLVFSASSFLATSHFLASRLTVFGSVLDWLIEGREVLETCVCD
jgi:hypothetical protein